MTYYLIRLLLTITFLLPFYIMIRRFIIKLQDRQVDKVREVFLAFFLLFCFGLLSLALRGSYQSLSLMLQSASGRIHSGQGINLIPFKTIRHFFIHFAWNPFLINIIGNIIMFIPWGFFPPCLWKRYQSAFHILFLSAFLPVFIETFQLFINRQVDVDDLILNFIGGCLGGILYGLLRKHIPRIHHYSI